jgi:GNAT superfamily N-acetyltransferase
MPRAQHEAATIHYEADGPFWRFIALMNGRRVGYAYCHQTSGRLNIQDLHVYDSLRPPWSITDPIRVLLRLPRPAVNFRGNGIGTVLITRIIEEARKEQIQEIWGSVKQDDVNATPGLLDWYQRRGFMILEPDAECLKDSAWRISLTFPEAAHHISG